MCYGRHGDMPSRYPSKEILVSASAPSFKIMPFPEQPTFMADGSWRYKGPAIWAQYGVTLMSCWTITVGMLYTIAQILLLSALLRPPPSTGVESQSSP